MKKFSSSPANIISQVRLLLVVSMLITIGIISLVFWQLYQHDKTNRLTIHYYNASSQVLNAISYEMLMIKANVNKANTILPSLHIINKTASELFAIQKEFQLPRFNRSLKQLKTQLIPLLAAIEIQQKPQQSIQPEIIDAILLTLKQLERLHNISNQIQSDKAIEAEKIRLNIMLGLLLGMILLGGFISRSTLNSIQQILKSEKQNKEKLSEEKQLIYTTLNSIGDAVITTNTSGQITNMNPVAEKLTGWLLENAMGLSLKTIFSIIDASNRKPIAGPVEKVIATGEIIYLSNHTTLISKDGTEYQIADSAAPIRDGDGDIQGVVLVFNDVTEQYQLREKAGLAQQSLKVKEKEQRDILNSMVNAVISINENGEILSFNKAAEDLFGYNCNEIIGENVSRLMPEPYAIKHDGYLKRYIQTGEAHVIGLGREVEGLRKNVETFPMRLLAAELPKDIDGKRRFIGSCIDLTHSKQQQEQLRRSQKMDALGKLTGGIAHDYNNMLGVILGYSEIIEGIVQEQPELANYIHEIQHAGERGAKLTKKLLTFSRRESSENKIVNLNTLLQDSQLMLEKTLTVRINLVLELEKDLWQIYLDVNDLEDAILNMSINAMHAIEGNGQVTFETRNEVINEIDAQQFQMAAGEYVLLSITDTGCGMDSETKEKIFDPFYSTKGELGTGLGLSQVYGLVQRSKGNIKIYSEPGHGSRFTLYFPRYYESEIKEKQFEGEKITDLTGHQTILIVDDEPALVRLTSHILAQQGYQVFSASNGKEALLILEKEPIDVLLSDVIMPEMDGYQLAAIVLEKYPNIKIQLASGFSDDRHLDNINSSLHQNLLHKPYHSKKLLLRIHELLNGSLD